VSLSFRPGQHRGLQVRAERFETPLRARATFTLRFDLHADAYRSRMERLAAGKDESQINCHGRRGLVSCFIDRRARNRLICAFRRHRDRRRARSHPARSIRASEAHGDIGLVLTVTSDLFHPAAFGVGLTVAVSVAGTLSTPLIVHALHGEGVHCGFRAM